MIDRDALTLVFWMGMYIYLIPYSFLFLTIFFLFEFIILLLLLFIFYCSNITRGPIRKTLKEEFWGFMSKRARFQHWLYIGKKPFFESLRWAELGFQRPVPLPRAEPGLWECPAQLQTRLFIYLFIFLNWIGKIVTRKDPYHSLSKAKREWNSKQQSDHMIKSWTQSLLISINLWYGK
jgi:hypothetical protein